MEQKFHFMNGLSNDEESKKLMRSHVMKGKNVGKKIHRRSRLESQVTRSQSNAEAESSHICSDLRQKYHDADWRYLSPNRLSMDFGNAFLTFSLPVEITPYSLEVINEFFIYTSDRIYPVRLGVSLQDAKFMWMRVLFESEATFHCSLALMQACNEIFHCNGQSSLKALYHLSQTFSQVKKRLEGEDALSDSTIAIVMSLINQEQIRQQHAAAAIHVKGLEKLIALRGGLDQLDGNTPLVLKICKTDIIFALQNGGPTSFFRDRMDCVQNSLWAQELRSDYNSNLSSSRYGRLEPNLRETFLDIMSICSVFNQLGSKTIDYFVYLEALVSLCYRLLKFRPLIDASTHCDAQSAYHIGLTIFMMTMFLQNDRRRILNYGLIPVCLKKVIHDEEHEHEDQFSLWLMIIGGIWISDGPGSAWLASRLRLMAQRLGCDSWETVRDSVLQYPWINGLHDQPGRELWNHVHNLDQRSQNFLPEAGVHS